MRKNFKNRENASAAGKKSKRGASAEKKDLRVAVVDLLSNNHEKLVPWLDQLGEDNPEMALSLFEQLTDQVLPRLESIKTPSINHWARSKEQEDQDAFNEGTEYYIFNPKF